ncbi:MAG: Cytochrome c oxidase assembly protein cox15 [Cirrosporium novae-zelandiae]|nr:MAG: Cytochrome c oxidase assembly protein cox15 [Cirrosporium novae-zelandiae]
MAFVLNASPLLRTAVPRLSKEFFTCRQCFRAAAPLKRMPFGKFAKPPFFQASRWNSSQAIPKKSEKSPLDSLSRTIGAKEARQAAGSKASKSFFPEVSDKSVAYWLLGSAASVFGIVIFGGLTRLTESGLSITEWKPVAGSLPPMSTEDWESEFEKYKATPEFAMLNSRITLEEFKKIYYMEWIHRIWGRFIGLSFVIPGAYFVARRRVSTRMAWRILGISGLIGFQGFVGWWMVASGLKKHLFAPGSHPRVSQYRLTAHLAAALATFTAMLWNGLIILRTRRFLADPAKAVNILKAMVNPKLKFFKKSTAAFAILTFATIMSGGFVAGLDAGLIYNEFPMMGLGLTPPLDELFTDFYCQRGDKKDLWWRNLFENPSLVQLEHRILGTSTFTAAIALFAYARYNPLGRGLLPASAMRGVHGVVGFAVLQFTLGLLTLLYMVPIPLASLHQANSMLLFTWSLVLGSRVWFPSKAAALVAKRMIQIEKQSAMNSHFSAQTVRNFGTLATRTRTMPARLSVGRISSKA